MQLVSPSAQRNTEPIAQALTALLPPGARCWLDGGHNADAGRALAGFFRRRGRPLHLVIGMLANKHPEAIVRALRGLLASVTVVPVPGHACHQAAAFSGIGAIAADSVPDALRRLSDHTVKPLPFSGEVGVGSINQTLRKPEDPTPNPSPEEEGGKQIEPTTDLQFNPAKHDVLIAGSLYLAGEVLQLNDEIPQ